MRVGRRSEAEVGRRSAVVGVVGGVRCAPRFFTFIEINFLSRLTNGLNNKYDYVRYLKVLVLDVALFVIRHPHLSPLPRAIYPRTDNDTILSHLSKVGKGVA